MPLYQYRCPDGHEFDAFTSISRHESVKACPECWQPSPQIINAPMLVKAAPVLCYDSPIDARPITSWDARREDLKRSGCIPYDPYMQQDSERRIKESDAALDQAVEQTVEHAVAKMDTKTRGKLHSELVDQGNDINVVRQ